ncbi:hypothetical protein IscW_ISCW023545 [Ixodes scapularis]|uniref:Uncharacterized protein n=1 Tax=Ixodes scapularis TaxID=6945 RepID=B7QIW0_IXOSC|nr:hypothetical protein IscW_ISCW023545 [Ixodes scapularis]|eukprot:XP_002415117.1 hypothetical protein IscW_ISCW023545 [Ixodes scapularis]
MAALRFTLFALVAVSVASAGYFHIEDKPGPPNWGCPELEIACSNHCFSIGCRIGECRNFPFFTDCTCLNPI